MFELNPLLLEEPKRSSTAKSTTWIVVAVVTVVVLANIWNIYRVATGIQSSPNWAGYVWPNAERVHSVSADMTVPTLNCRKTQNGKSSAWVGVGGFGAGSVWPFPQTGVNMDCLHGIQVNFTWCSHSSFLQEFVETGDRIFEEMYRESGNWFCEVDDLTSGRHQLSEVNYTYKGTVATSEWIVEDPTKSLKHQTLAKFADFDSVSFRNLKLSPERLDLKIGVTHHDLQIKSSSGKIEARPIWNGSELKITYQ